ncbi:hypothetical protein BDB01DRAFT_793608 [Pilobolus umbonatus]|nr:hypothetical protein BDB01DRAFT_826851 [Pilobolus umbonatus]KAI8982658.1 hypothetical protein BDB01DRAFT_793608 [Pilobolus umbonatus]
MSSKDHSRRRSRSPYRSRRYEDRRRRDSSDRRRYDDRRRHEDREDRRYEDKRHDEESNEPNINVVLRGLPDLATEEDIKNKLVKMEASIDDVSLIKDRDTGESRKFAFVRFTSVGHAIQFVEKNRSFIMSSYRVRVDYCHKSKLTDEKEEWRCSQCGFFNIISRRVCVECRQSYISSEAEKRTNALEAIEMNDGSKDISFSPSTMLLIRQLDHLSNEETVYNAVQSFQGVHRALLVRDKLTKMSCEFAFIEFTNIQVRKGNGRVIILFFLKSSGCVVCRKGIGADEGSFQHRRQTSTRDFC